MRDHKLPRDAVFEIARQFDVSVEADLLRDISPWRSAETASAWNLAGRAGGVVCLRST
jgi:hypothetical protein